MSQNLMVEERSLFKRFDINFAFVVLALNIIGLINLYSATHGAASVDVNPKFVSQIVWLSIGWFIYLVVTFLDYKIFSRLAYPIYFINLAFLAAVPLVGVTIYGAKRWLDLGFFNFQPSEPIKIILVLILARHLSRISVTDGLSVKQLFYPTLLAVVPFALTVRQPDLGTALMFLAVLFSMVLFVGVKRNILVVTGVAILVSLPIAWNFGLKDYQKNRVLTFLDPSRDPQGAGYNSRQSEIAVGSGKVIGKGFRKGTQSQLEFLPERHTDFIFSVLSEEHGFVGSLTTVGLFGILFLLGVRTASQARDKFGALIVVGGLAMIFWHMFINIGMVIGLLPIVGIPLPLISYGGSNLLPTMLALGLVSSVALRKYLF